MDIKPTLADAKRRLRIDDDLADDLQSAIDQAHAEAMSYLDRDALHPDQGALNAALALDASHTGIVVTADIINAQLLLADASVGDNDRANRESKRDAAFGILRRHRHMGA